MQRFGDGRDWFFEHRFGMFVHWGLYALPAWQEQILWRGNMTRLEYERLAGSFDPNAFDPEEWLDIAEAAGMSYLVFTTKHHDGFCMFDTGATEYRITNTPYGRDIVKELTDACHRRGFLVGFYYSLPDWHHPNYPNRGRHHEMFGPRKTDEPDETAYLAFVREQVTELCSNYGELCAFFWDVNVAGFNDPTLNELIRKLQPKAVINDRGPGPGDYSTPERHVPPGRAFQTPTEACQSMGRESWGYRDDEDYYSHGHLMRSIDRILAMDGNYLLNVGPRADGSFPAECIDGLQRIGDWWRRVHTAFTGTHPCSDMLRTPETHLFRYEDLLLTRRGNTFYAHASDPLQTGAMVLDGFEAVPERARLLNDGRSLQATVDIIPWRWQERPCLRISGIPVNDVTDEPLIVEFSFDESVVE